MELLLLALLLVVLFVGLCFAGRPYWGWVVSAALALAWWAARGIGSPLLFGLVATGQIRLRRIDGYRHLAAIAGRSEAAA